MSASHRLLIRLPLTVFEGLDITTSTIDNKKRSPEELRSLICSKLNRFPVKSRGRGGTVITTSASVKTVGDLLRISKRTLLRALDPLFTFGEIELFLKRTCQECASKPVTALTLLLDRRMTNENDNDNNNKNSTDGNIAPVGESVRWLPTGLASFDCQNLHNYASQQDNLHLRDQETIGIPVGGIRVGSLTEVVGRAGVGKTQLALQLILMAAKYNQGAMYIDTEKKLNLNRLREMAMQRYNLQPQQQQPHSSALGKLTNNYKHPNQLLNNVTVKQPNSTQELFQVLEQAEEEILHRNHHYRQEHKHQNKNYNNDQSSLELFPVRLLIVDSIAAPLNRDFGSDSAPKRAAAVFSMAKILKQYADQLDLAVVVINQVGLDNNYSTSNTTRNTQSRNDPIRVRAALGMPWHHCVSTRLFLEHDVDPHRLLPRNDEEEWRFENSELEGQNSTTAMRSSRRQDQLRTLSVVKSNMFGFSTLQFEITSVGLEEVE